MPVPKYARRTLLALTVTITRVPCRSDGVALRQWCQLLPRGDVEDLHPTARGSCCRRMARIDMPSRLDTFVRVHDKHSRSIPGGSLMEASHCNLTASSHVGFHGQLGNRMSDSGPAARSCTLHWSSQRCCLSFGSALTRIPNTNSSVHTGGAENTASLHHSSRARDTLQLSCRDARQPPLRAERVTDPKNIKLASKN